MDRIDSTVGIATDANGNRIFQAENLVAGIDGTDVTDVWLTGVQEEIQALQTLDAHAPVAGSNGQLLAALIAAFPGIVAAGRAIANPGYIRLPGGLILQMGRATTVTGNQDVFAFTVPFPAQIIGVVANEDNATGWVTAGGLAPHVFGTTLIANDLSHFEVSCVTISPSGNTYSAGSGFTWLALGA